MSNTEATRKQLKIKSGVVKRYHKEITLYNAEVVENKARLESATAAAGGGEESWDVKNAKSLIRESENMVRDTAARLERAVGELGDLVKSVKGNSELEKDAELLDAEAVLAAATSA
ncbi:tubulin binding cofactor A-domain-containing protein [Lactarius psammicola]|nr:tubulin binding cofactor A-domain-containing protein [Lactarius psammicola]